MQQDDRIRIQHVLDSALDAQSFIDERIQDDLNQDRMLVLALVKAIEINGEAASRISEETCERYPAIPWMSIISTRNRLVHAYYDIDLNILWDTVWEELPPLVEDLQKILAAGD
jgi:uncharacterized protein with HEPN domain